MSSRQSIAVTCGAAMTTYRIVAGCRAPFAPDMLAELGAITGAKAPLRTPFVTVDAPGLWRLAHR